jgi:hypothetical protein
MNKIVKVQINTKRVLKDKRRLSPEYIKFVEQNRDKIFTAQKDPLRPNSEFWTFIENQDWIFHPIDLKIVSFVGENEENICGTNCVFGLQNNCVYNKEMQCCFKPNENTYLTNESKECPLYFPKADLDDLVIFKDLLNK